MLNDKAFRVAVIGRSWLAADVLRRLTEIGCDCALLGEPTDQTAPAKAQDLGIPCKAKPLSLPVLSDDFPWRPDLIVSAHSFRILPSWLIQWARLGAIGYHQSLLPAYRGRRAIQDALDDGVRFTGGSVYWLTGEIDAGPVVVANNRRLQESVQIIPDETALSLWKRALAPLGSDLLIKGVAALTEI